MKLTVASVAMHDMTTIFRLADYDLLDWQDTHFYTYLADKMGYNVAQLKTALLNNFNGVTHEEFNDVYFYNIKDAKRALEWVESMVVANRLRGKFKEDKIFKFDTSSGQIRILGNVSVPIGHFHIKI
jgi:hypothetical protein